MNEEEGGKRREGWSEYPSNQNSAKIDTYIIGYGNERFEVKGGEEKERKGREGTVWGRVSNRDEKRRREKKEKMKE